MFVISIVNVAGAELTRRSTGSEEVSPGDETPKRQTTWSDAASIFARPVKLETLIVDHPLYS